MQNIIDRRVQKTRRLLQDALVSLISEKGYEAVTIQEILDRANVGRSTFYIHYDNKHDLLHSCFNDFVNLFEQSNAEISRRKKYSGDLNETGFVLNLLRLAQRNHSLVKAFLGKDGIAIFNRSVYNYIFAYIDLTIKGLAQSNKSEPLKLEMLTHYITSAFIGMLNWWVERDMPCSVEEVDKYFKQFMMRDIREILV